MRRFQIVIILSVLLFGACQSYYNVVPVKSIEEAPKSNGFYYSLPRNVITIDITVKNTMQIAGPYAEYASKYLGLKNVIRSNQSIFELSDIKINSYSEPDPDHFYFVDLEKYKPAKGNEMMMRLSEAGLIHDINDNSEAKVKEEKTAYQEQHEIDYSQTFKYFAESNLVEKIDTIVETIDMDTITIEKTTFKTRLVEKDLEQKAKEAAEFIERTRSQHFDIITGAQEVPYSSATVEYMSSELKRLEEEYMKMFTGITFTTYSHYRYYYLPESHVYSASVPLFKFHKKAGIVDKDYKGGEMVYIHVDRSRNTQHLETFVKNNVNQEAKQHGYYYRIPEYAKFSIKQGIELKAEVNILVSQFGIVTSLPPTHNKVQFFPNTGAIRTVEVDKE